jgi:D-aminopeptidase
VGETNDGYLNDIRGRHVGRAEVLAAIANAHDGVVVEGAVGAGTGTVAFGFKGGIGSASRKAAAYTVGVLVQSNFGGTLQMGGAPVGRELAARGPNSGNGSILMVVATDAPVDARNLRRMAARTCSVWRAPVRAAPTVAAITRSRFPRCGVPRSC